MGGDSVHDMDCVTRLIYGSLTGAGFGTVLGSVELAWKSPAVNTVQHTPKSMVSLLAKRSGVLGAAAGVFSVTECMTNSFLGQPKWEGTLVGGLSTGAVYGLVNRSPVGGLTFGLVISLACIVYDFNDSKLIDKGDNPFEKLGLGKRVEQN